ncbi:serine carboxypeptidase 1-like [Hordeum vulgare subsp. vulgare]|uniref:Carboxypeptidase n=1 Tax=Hordeum vulgare subsp. vulgare TaxID=112509 RepID=A0A8I6XEZ3_HORVV|nr:serine carboxypeptidase 1-like [Hordeum vulgare subsp. vulgare]
MKFAAAALHVLLFIPALALHARASQEAHLTKFLLSRTTSSTTTSDPSLHDKPFLEIISDLRTDEYPVSDPGAQKASDKITALPGQPEGVDFGQYGGYVTVDSHNGRALFYYFVESPDDAMAKPLLLWLNGGPGCSSLGHGAMRELGPFRANRDGKTLTVNKHAWNKVANVIFLESPAGVGFSYSNTSSDYDRMGDPMAAQDAYIFLLNWLDRFPEYKARPLYITGESYAGHYIPQLAATILAHNNNNKSNNNNNNNNNTINLKGIMVGNPYLDKMKNLIGHYEYLWSHGAISDEVWADIASSCSIDRSSINVRCYHAVIECQDGILDHDNIYGPTCIIDANGSYYSSTYLPGYDPCSYVPTKAYLNSPQVQKALHARETKWLDCRSFEDFKDSPDTMVPTLKRLINRGLPIWLFSGDFDSVCPFTGTRYTVRDLNLSVVEPWRPWTAGHEVGGYVQQYARGFTFATCSSPSSQGSFLHSTGNTS